MQDEFTNKKTVFEILNKLNKFPYCFYSDFSRLGLSLAANTGKLQLSFSKALPDSTRGKKEKGKEAFVNDRKEMRFFTLQAEECAEACNNVVKVMKDTYVNNDKNVKEEYKKVYTITHYKDSDKSDVKLATRLSFQRYVSKNNDYVGLKVTILPPEDKDHIISFVLRGGQIDVFLTFMEAGKYSAVGFQTLVAFIKTVNMLAYDDSDDKSKKSYTKKSYKKEEPVESENEYNSSDDDNSSSGSDSSTDSSDDDVPW